MWVAMALAVGYTYEAEQQYLEMAHHVLKKTAEFSLDSLDCCRIIRCMAAKFDLELHVALGTGTLDI